MMLDIITLGLIAAQLVQSARIPGSAQFQYIKGLTPRDNSNNKCPVDIPLSCTDDSAKSNSCCYEYPGGIILQTQFWDYSPATGPDDVFTLHGLWPDNCSKDGSYQQNCNSKLNVGDVASVLKSFGEDELLTKMQTNWKNLGGNDANLWKHEFNKHGTCVNTINPSCYGDDFKTNQNVVDYFKIAYNLYEKLPTYKWLTEAGITPSTDKTYTKEEILKVLTDKFGSEPYIGCDSKNALNEVWYFHQLKGSLLGENFQHIDSFSNSKCPSTGIKFTPKGSNSPSPTKSSNPSKPTGDSSRGFVKLSNQDGCLIKNGKWYVSGTCATYTLEKLDQGVKLRSNGGYCNVDSTKVLSCTKSNDGSIFQIDSSSKILSIDGQNEWNADHVPSSNEQVEINANGDGSIKFNLTFE
ncbi:Ribonuclease [Wickerhamomyces ciferrii]|uniref:Ribonuclease T2-like n=1 Tax=Wickerhamomyces ciferrii (strain ATCC 14091 / BCRC 22168 / CBS 111 / JCM 3599 / NBRC 0793 / NRRL Y-1031 F-60-10) TaxID=1206466 RepID=K0KFE7_WICCF|nr:Ribonuclease [Wickerhamomyces ciferrii]CCH43845.1 Ribonuclease [Wickerhamomyces ciferrii]